MSYSRIEKTTLPSALSGFTSEFDMESGGPHLLLSSDKILVHYCDPQKKLGLFSNLETLVKPHEQLVQVSSMPYSTYTPCLSTS